MLQVKETPMRKQKEPKYPLAVTVTPNPRPDYPDHAGVEARVKFTEGEAVFGFAFGDITDKDLAATVGKALEEGKLRDVKFDSDTAGLLHVMWKGESFPVSFWVRMEGPNYLYSKAKSALKERVSKEL
jgi:hypothetical protein